MEDEGAGQEATGSPGGDRRAESQDQEGRVQVENRTHPGPQRIPGDPSRQLLLIGGTKLGWWGGGGGYTGSGNTAGSCDAQICSSGGGMGRGD